MPSQKHFGDEASRDKSFRELLALLCPPIGSGSNLSGQKLFLQNTGKIPCRRKLNVSKLAERRGYLGANCHPRINQADRVLLKKLTVGTLDRILKEEGSSLNIQYSEKRPVFPGDT